MLIDTHAHLYWDAFKEDFDEMIQRSLDAGVSAIINVGVDIEKSREALDQARNTKWPKGLSVYSTIGIHPHEALRYFQGKLEPAQSIHEDIEKLEQIYLSDPKKVVGVGECGLDYFFRNEDLPTVILGSGTTPESIDSGQARVTIKTLQKMLFKAHLDLAKKLNLPLIVHCRDDRSKNPANSECWDNALEMIGSNSAILHCYSGLPNTTLRLLRQCSGQVRSGQANLLVSFAANITYPKNEYLREAAKILPLNKILLETDSPFLAPQSKRGQRNEPSAVAEIARLIANLKGISFAEVANQTTKNARKIFNINK